METATESNHNNNVIDDVASLVDFVDPFKNLKISSHEPLFGLKRSKCPQCKASRMYFCYTCYKYVEGVDVCKFPKINVSNI